MRCRADCRSAFRDASTAAAAARVPPTLFPPPSALQHTHAPAGKLGGGAGGHKNWKDRYFVLSDHLYYYNNQAAFQKEPKAPLGRVVLNCYFCSRSEDASTFEFNIDAYPKVRSGRSHAAYHLRSGDGCHYHHLLHNTVTTPLPPPACSPAWLID